MYNYSPSIIYGGETEMKLSHDHTSLTKDVTISVFLYKQLYTDFNLISEAWAIPSTQTLKNYK